MQLQVWAEQARATQAGEVFPESHISRDDGPYLWGGKAKTWFARYSAQGYMDCTDFCHSQVGPIDAAYAAFELYGDTERGSVDSIELARTIRALRKEGWRK